jgi:type I restriction enzyme R subunit
VRNVPERNLAVELLERLFEGEIKTRFATNVAQNNKFSEMLPNVIKRYQNRSIETAQVMEELTVMSKKFRKRQNAGPMPASMPTNWPSTMRSLTMRRSVRELGDETLKDCP